MPAKGITISVTAETNSGGRRHMEDYLAVRLSPNESLQQHPDLREQAYIGVFDGHGGKEAAKFARERLWDLIQLQPKYLSTDMESIRESIEEAFVALHYEMEPLRGECTIVTICSAFMTFYVSFILLKWSIVYNVLKLKA